MMTGQYQLEHSMRVHRQTILYNCLFALKMILDNLSTIHVIHSNEKSHNELEIDDVMAQVEIIGNILKVNSSSD